MGDLMKEFLIQNTIIKLYLGDITNLDTEAIVNAANNHLYLGSGVAGAIKKKGGVIIEQEAIKKGPIQIGEAVTTSAGNLKAKYIIHAASMRLDLKTDSEKIQNATKNALLRCEELKIKSVGIPSLGTGVGGFSLNKAAKIMVNEVIEHVKNNSNIKEIVFALFTKNAFYEFNNALKEKMENQ